MVRGGRGGGGGRYIHQGQRSRSYQGRYKERKGRDWKGNERKGKKWKGKERKGMEWDGRKGREGKGME